VIAWPIPESEWEHLHNTIRVVDYDDTVTGMQFVNKLLTVSI